MLERPTTVSFNDNKNQKYIYNDNDYVITNKKTFPSNEIVKVISLNNKGIATSGTAIRGQHIYNPHEQNVPITDIVSMTVIGPNVYEADRFATAAFAMGAKGINFIEMLPDCEGYMIDKNGIATYTKRFKEYVITNSLKSSDSYKSV
jgi:thiamine biosynthesis lipoprotein